MEADTSMNSNTTYKWCLMGLSDPSALVHNYFQNKNDFKTNQGKLVLTLKRNGTVAGSCPLYICQGCKARCISVC